jgi:Zn finger protein HypA/HybF involved in hydrogenase expression
MKILEDLKVQFKEIEFVCRCGKTQKVIILVGDDYGFETTTCENCKKRNFIEYDNSFVKVKSL